MLSSGLRNGRGEDRPEGAQWPPLVAQGASRMARREGTRVPVAGAIHSIKSERIRLPLESSLQVV
jgi:hypothetical protein